MDKITLLKEMNQSTKTDKFERALIESGIELPPEEDEFGDEEMGGEIDAEMAPDEEDIGDDEMGAEVPLDDEELQDIVDWCDEECGEMDDGELQDTLAQELEELELSSEELDATISRVMTMLGRGEEEGDEFADDEGEIDGEMGEPSDEELPPADDEIQF